MKSYSSVVAFAAFVAAATPAAALFGATGGLIALGSGAAVTQAIVPLAGLGLLKLGKLLAIASDDSLNPLNGGRKRRSADEAEEEELTAMFHSRTDRIFGLLAEAEPARCYSRIVCEVAAQRMEMAESGKIMALFNRQVPVESPMYDYATAAAVGAKTAAISDYDACELRYTCPLSKEEMSNLI